MNIFRMLLLLEKFRACSKARFVVTMQEPFLSACDKLKANHSASVLSFLELWEVVVFGGVQLHGEEVGSTDDPPVFFCHFYCCFEPLGGVSRPLRWPPQQPWVGGRAVRHNSWVLTKVRLLLWTHPRVAGSVSELFFVLYKNGCVNEDS